VSMFVVSYDLNKSGQDYEAIHKRIKSWPTHWHMQGSVWLIVTTDSVTTIRDHIQKVMDNNDKLFVAKLSSEAAWKGYSSNISEWLKNYLK
jgi:CRISPR/Cas system-associated endoribonuclease Cas2